MGAGHLSVRGPKSILVTGVAGFIGFHVAGRLMERGESVIGLDSLDDYYSVALKRARIKELRGRHGTRFHFNQTAFADTAALADAFDTLSFDRLSHLGTQQGLRHSSQQPHSH